MMLQFDVECRTSVGQHVAVCGTGGLGDWDVARSLLLKPVSYPTWSGEMQAGPDAFEFKYSLVEVDPDDAERKLLQWEAPGPNRSLDPRIAGTAQRLVLHHYFGDLHRGEMEVVLAPSAEALACDPTPMGPSASAGAESGGGGASAVDDAVGRKDSAGSGDSGSQPPASSTGSPDSSSSGARSSAASEGVLESLNVGASVRFGRLMQSRDAFGERYELFQTSVLGTGMSGSVCVARARDTGAEVAVKTLKMEGHSQFQLEQIRSEVENQMSMDHPNICRLLEVYEEPGVLRLVMERMRGPDLFEHLSMKGRYTERDAAHCVRQMTSAVAYCHRYGVCHRDLKLENFCLEDASPDARVKMIDFGLSAVCTASVPLTNSCGTLYYVAPEVLRQNYDKKCDMWSLGVITYILLAGHAPFQGHSDRETAVLIIKGSYKFQKQRWSHISDTARVFIAGLLEVDVGKRLDAEAALQHPWLCCADAQAVAERVVLDTQVLQGMRAFTNSNTLKRAVLRAVSPLATVEHVARWADAFQALDTEGTGEVAVEDLTKRLVELADLGPQEASELCMALAAADGGEIISYSAFLAACLSAHMTFGDRELRAIFDRLDQGGTGYITAEEVSKALGDVVDTDTLAREFPGQKLSYTEFRWLMTMPRLGPTIIGLRQLLGACEQVSASWRLSTRKAKSKSRSMPVEGDDTALEAARRENMTWRLWRQQLSKGTLGESGAAEPPRLPPKIGFALLLDSHLVARGLCSEESIEKMHRAQKRHVVIRDLVQRGLGSEDELTAKADQELVERDASPPATRAGATHSEGRSSPSASVAARRMPTLHLVQHMRHADDPQAAWELATVEAKDGDVEAARRENMAWRVEALHGRTQGRAGVRGSASTPVAAA